MLLLFFGWMSRFFLYIRLLVLLYCKSVCASALNHLFVLHAHRPPPRALTSDAAGKFDWIYSALRVYCCVYGGFFILSSWRYDHVNIFMNEIGICVWWSVLTFVTAREFFFFMYDMVKSICFHFLYCLCGRPVHFSKQQILNRRISPNEHFSVNKNCLADVKN